MEGIIALAGLLVCATVLVCAGLFFAVLASKVVIFERPIFRGVFFAMSFVIATAICWLIPNFEYVQDQVEMNRVSTDCGWKEYKLVGQVEGVFHEDFQGTRTYLESYPAVEYPGNGGKVYRVTRSDAKPERLVDRTFRYGFKTKEQHISEKIVRTEHIIFDFEANEVLAKNIHYLFTDTGWYSLKSIFFAFVTFPRSGCGFMSGADEWRNHYRSILQPKGTLTPAQYAAVQNRESIDVKIEILESEYFKPLKTISSEEWGQLSYDKLRDDMCRELVRPEYSGAQFMFFLRDTTLTNKAPAGNSTSICESNQIWLVRYSDLTDSSKVVIEKYTPIGELVYKIRFQKPDESGGHLGSIGGPTFRAQAGHLNFEWFSSDQSGTTRNISRRLLLRLKEPDAGERSWQAPSVKVPT